MVALPKDVKVVINDTVAPCLVDKDEGLLTDCVVEKAVEKRPGELAGDDGVVEGGVAVGIDIEDVGDSAVLTIAAKENLCDNGVGIDGCADKGIG